MLWNERKKKKSSNVCETYCIKTKETCSVGSKKYTANENISVRKTKQNRSHCHILLWVGRKSQLS